MRKIMPWLITISAAGCFVSLGLFSYARYHQEPIRHVERPATAEKTAEKPVSQHFRPKTEHERLAMIATIWGLERGPLEIGRLK